MNREKMLYHANEKGTLNFDVRSMKAETRDNLQFLLDGGYLIRDPESLFAGGPKDIWQDFRITGDGKILLAVYRLEFAHINDNSEKRTERWEKLQDLLEENNRTIEYFVPSLTKKQMKAINYMNNNSTEKSASSYVQDIKNAQLDPWKVKSSEEWQEDEIKHERQKLGIDPIPVEIDLDNIDLDELSLRSAFNMSVGLGPRGTDSTRHEDYVMKKCAEELGELSLEINISQGLSYKEPGKDGIKGEAVDLAICALDMFALQCNNMSPEEIEREFLSYMLTKLNKWRDTLK